jgi:hypothetical protein
VFEKLTAVFGLFGRRYHEPTSAQRTEVRRIYSRPLADQILQGESCDRLSGSSGAFGKCASNPIPVNGSLGTLKYLGKLRTKAGRSALYFHRIWSAASPITRFPVDAYETVSIDAKSWDVLFVDMYHPRRSRNAPEGYVLTPYVPELDGTFCCGCNVRLGDFPDDLPAALEKKGFPDALVRKCRERLEITNFSKPIEHLARLKDLEVDAVSTDQFNPGE